MKSDSDFPTTLQFTRKHHSYSVENALCVVKEPLIPLLEAMAVPPEAIEKIQNQWGKITLLDWKQISSTPSFWCQVHSYKDACAENPFAELATFAMSMLVLPYSNAEVERTFSQLNIVKSKLKPETTNAILVQSCHEFKEDTGAGPDLLFLLRANSLSPRDPATVTCGTKQRAPDRAWLGSTWMFAHAPLARLTQTYAGSPMSPLSPTHATTPAKRKRAPQSQLSRKALPGAWNAR
ncbi:hypothetical protein MRX96_017134 [Rhipicephalus microplus]